jgi:tripartite-type tricarboxylate transporter receptor subunit TctC
MSKSMGQPVLIENRPGAGGTIAASQVAKSDPDGYTVLVHSSGHAWNPSIYPNLALRHRQGSHAWHHAHCGIAQCLGGGLPARGWKGVGDLIAADAKAAPGQLNYASAGMGSATHLNAEKFKLQAGPDAVHVPFKGTPEALSDVIGGRNDWFFAPTLLGLAAHQRRQTSGLGREHCAALPETLPQVPTTVEAGVAGSGYVFWVGRARALCHACQYCEETA